MPTGQNRSHSPQSTQRPARWMARVMFQLRLPRGCADVSIHCGCVFSTMHCSQMQSGQTWRQA